MGRPRKLDRLTRTITARVSDEQYDWLAEEAIAWHKGDLSKAVRDAIESAQSLQELLRDPDPGARIARMREEGERQLAEEEIASAREEEAKRSRGSEGAD